MSEFTELEITAYHEAGHAVAAYILKQPFEYVTIIPDDECTGIVQMSITNFWRDFDKEALLWEEEEIDAVEAQIKISLAGPVAAGKVTGQDGLDILEGNDRNAVVNLAMMMTPDAAEYVDELLGDTQQLLQDNWGAVQELARELLAKKRLDEGEARETIRRGLSEEGRNHD